jgi:hypothetical protein
MPKDSIPFSIKGSFHQHAEPRAGFECSVMAMGLPPELRKDFLASKPRPPSDDLENRKKHIRRLELEAQELGLFNE